MIRRNSVGASLYACTERTIDQGVLSLNREIEHGGVGVRFLAKEEQSFYLLHGFSLALFVIRPLNPYVDADDRRYFRFKYPFLHVSKTELSLSDVNTYI